MAGCFIMLIAMYYLFFKAGIPYQDPPLELQIEYAINMGIGKRMGELALLTGFFGAAGWIILFIAGKLKKKSQ